MSRSPDNFLPKVRLIRRIHDWRCTDCQRFLRYSVDGFGTGHRGVLHIRIQQLRNLILVVVTIAVNSVAITAHLTAPAFDEASPIDIRFTVLLIRVAPLPMLLVRRRSRNLCPPVSLSTPSIPDCEYVPSQYRAWTPLTPGSVCAREGRLSPQTL